MSELSVADVPNESRFEGRVDGELAATAVYRSAPGVVSLVHTLVLPGWEGKGIGSQLIQGVLDDVRTRGLLVDPECPFVSAWLKRHDGYADLVAASA